ncbi:MAG: hypothetical protein AAF581_20455 [Planctomycetota bacterium]
MDMLARRNLARWVFCCCLVFASSAAAQLSLVGEVKVPCHGATNPAARFSGDGCWLVVAHRQHKDTARRTWSRRGFTLIDARKGQAVRTEKKVRIGRNRPVFSRNSQWLAWCEEEQPGRAPVRRLAPGADPATKPKRFTVSAALSPRSYPTLTAIADDGQRVAIFDPGPSRDRQRIVVYDLSKAVVEHVIADFREPYMGLPSFEVVLTDGFVLSHTRPDGAASGGAYQLVVTELTEGTKRGVYGSYVANSTPRFALLRDGCTLINGTGGFCIEEVDLRSGKKVQLLDAREALYSHFLEVTVCPNERFVLAWSRERRQVVGWDRQAKKRYDIPLAERGTVLGIDRCERVLLHAQPKGVLAVDLSPPHDSRWLLRGKYPLVIVDPAGQHLVSASKEPPGAEARWRFACFQLPQGQQQD